MPWGLLLVGLLLLPVLAAPAAPATQPGAEAKLIRELYGKRIASAMASEATQDNIELAQELMTSAAESATPLGVRRLLAVEAVKLAAATGTTEGARVARMALRLTDRLAALNAVDQRRLGLEIAQKRFDAARRASAPGSILAPLASDVAEAALAFAEALLDDRQLDEAEAALKQAVAMTRAYEVSDGEKRIEAAWARLRVLQERAARIGRAEATLAYAEEAGDADRIKAARKDLALLHLLAEGDIPKAGAFMAGTGHADEAAVSAAAEHLKDPKAMPPAGKCNDVVQRLCDLAEQAENEEARTRIGSAAAKICRSFLDAAPAGLQATKARLLLTRAERLAGESPADRFIDLLRKSYQGLAGNIRVLQDKAVRVSYDFTESDQLGDFAVLSGPWKAGTSKGILVTAPPRNQAARLASRLRFRADKPLTLRYQVSGREQLAGLICLLENNDPNRRPHEVTFELGSFGNRGSSLHDGGSQGWSSSQLRVGRNLVYRVEAEWDGKKTFIWTVNKKLLCRHDTRFDARRLPYASAYVALGTRGFAAGFDDVVVEGTILEDPSRRLTPPRQKP